MNSRETTFFKTLAIVFLLCSCASSQKSPAGLRGESGYCYPAVMHPYDSVYQPLDSIAVLAQIPTRAKYSRHSIMVANATGVLKILKAQDAVAFHGPEWWQLQQKIMTRLFLVSTEIESIAAELDCEGERADQVADYLTQNENQRVKKLTILSITSGALAGIGNAVLHSHHAAVASAVIGGSISAGLGLSALFSGHKVTFMHRRNLLGDFWLIPKSSSSYSPAIWYMLSEKFFSNEQKNPIALNMKKRWIAYEELKPADKKSEPRIKLLFGDGGKYSADDLRSRSRMLNQIQAAVKLMNQDLQGLIEEL